MKKPFLFLLLLLPFSLFAQYQIKLKSKGVADSIAYFRGTFFDDKNYLVKDTLNLKKSLNNISSRKSIVGGIYFLYFPKTKEKIHFAIDNKDTFDLELSGSQYLESIKTNSKENDVFFKYQLLERKYAIVDTLYAEEVKRGRKFSLAQKDAFFKEKIDTLYAFRKNAMGRIKKASALYSYFLSANILDETLPDRRNYALRDGFISRFNLNQPQLFFTPLMQDILYEYLSFFPLHADSLAKGMDFVINKINCDAKAYPFIIDYFLKIIKNRNLQNNAEAFVYMVEKYIKNPKCKYPNQAKAKLYLDQLTTSKVAVDNDTALNLILADTSGTSSDMLQFSNKFDYTAIMFYSPTCEHCQVEMPIMDSVIAFIEQRYKIAIGKYAICNEPGVPKKTWVDFIEKYKLHKNYLHVSLPQNGTNIRNAYDAYSNPVFYLINNKNQFVLRKFGSSSLKRYFAELQVKK
jgi:hypothetical protein